MQSRFEMMKDEYLAACEKISKNGGKVTLEFGLQTANKSEQKAIDRGTNLTLVDQWMETLHKRNMPFEVSLIYGLPNQTLESFKESVEYCLKRKVPVLKAWPLMLLRGTKLELEKEKYDLREDLIENSTRIHHNIPHVVSSSTFSENEWRQMHQIAFLLRKTEGAHPGSVDELLAM